VQVNDPNLEVTERRLDKNPEKIGGMASRTARLVAEEVSGTYSS